jgi:hypothetical protein
MNGRREENTVECSMIDDTIPVRSSQYVFALRVGCCSSGFTCYRATFLICDSGKMTA